MSDKLITVKPRGVKSGEINVYKSSICSGKSTFWEDLKKVQETNND